MPLLLVACSDERATVQARTDEPGRSASTAVAPDGTASIPSDERMASAEPSAPADLASLPLTARETAVLEFDGDLAALAPLATADPDPGVRLAAVQRLADGDTPVARAALRRALADTDPDVVAEAILAVAALDDRKAVPALRRLRTHPDAEIRGLAEDALDSLER